MKKIFFFSVLGFGLLTLTACGHTEKNVPVTDIIENDSVAQVEVVESEAFTDGNYQVSLEDSSLAWQGEKVVGKSHTGLINLKSGNLIISDGKLTGGQFIMDMESISSDEGIDALVKHLKSDDFFNVAAYPEAILKINSADTMGTSSYAVNADLTIKGIVIPITFQTDLSQSDGMLLAMSNFTIDRTNWDIRYGSGQFFKELGDEIIKDEISFTVSLKAGL